MRVHTLAAIAALALPVAACGGANPSGKSPQDLVAELPAPYNTGDIGAGKQVFQLCSACHTIGADQPSTVGPNLHGLFGRKGGAKTDFKNTPELVATGQTWDAETIARWVTAPQAEVPATKMLFIGVKDPKQRTDLIAYLKVATSQ